MDNRELIVEALRKYAEARMMVFRKQAKQEMGLTDPQIDNAMNSLLRQGFLRRVSTGVYEFVDLIPEKADMDEKMWRAMRVSTTFTSEDIARLTEARPDLVQRFFRRMLRDEYIKPSGKIYEQGDRRRGRNQYRLTLKGQDMAYRPEQKAYRPDKLIADTAALNRLVCTGLAQNDDTALDNAINLSRVIYERLTDLRGGE
ncbi:MAG: hypothetical protein ABIK15_07155 [Pseudomonadota bacterium]